MKERQNKIQSALYALFLPLHIVNTLNIGSVKLFYIPVFIMGLWGIRFFDRECRRNKYVRYLIAFSLLSALSLINGGPRILSGLLAMYLILLSMLPFLQLEKSLFYTLSPILFLCSLAASFALSDWPGLPVRYTGMYNDPNYFVMSIILGLFLCFQAMSKGGLIQKIICVTAMAFSFYCILLTQSRGGILSLALFLVLVLYRLYKYKRSWAIAISIAGIFASAQFAIIYQDNIELIVNRFLEKNDNDRGGHESRYKEADAAFASIAAHPELALFGAGYGISSDAEDEGYTPEKKELRENRYMWSHRIHMTPIAILYENGLFALFAMAVLTVTIIKSLYIRCDWLVMGLFVAIVFQSMTFHCLPYLPFWQAYFIAISVCIQQNGMAIAPSTSVNQKSSYKLTLASKYVNP